MPKTHHFTQTIQAAPALVYKAFTNQTALNQWLCNASYINVALGGGFLFDWNDHIAIGQITAFEADKQISFTWQDAGDSSVSRLDISMEGDDAQSTLTLLRHDVNDDDPKDRWNDALENLKSVLETGIDLRLQRRPIMGVMPGAFNPEKAKELGVPVAAGLLISSIMDGFSAAGAGLQVDDVVISMDGNELGTFQQYLAATKSFQVGQTVEVVYYRGGDKHTVDMLLKERPIPQYPATLKALAASLKQAQATANAELRKIVAGVDTKVLETAPAEGSWSACEVLAHLIWCERYTHMMIWAAEGGAAAVPFPGNNAVQLQGILYAFDTEQLVDVLEAELAVTVGIIKTLPETFLDHKADYAAIAGVLTNGPFLGPPHIHMHLAQIQKAIDTVTAAV